MISNLEGYPIAEFSLSQEELVSLQEHYLPDLLSKNNDELNEIEEAMRYYGIDLGDWSNQGIMMGDGYFDKYKEITEDYIHQYLSWYKFSFDYKLSFDDSWVNVHEKGDHQYPHDHLDSRCAFSTLLILKQPNEESGQFVLDSSNLSSHLKCFDLGMKGRFPNEYKPEMFDGKFIVFPSCIKHYVTKNQHDDLRVVMVSNIKVDREEQ